MRENIALVLLAGAGIVAPVAGWLLGVGLLWSSRAWTLGEKVLGSLLTPGMLLIPVVLVLGSTSDVCVRTAAGTIRCGGGKALLPEAVLIALLLALVIVPILTALFLHSRASRRAMEAA